MGAPLKANSREAREARERLLKLKNKYDNRITTVRFGNEFHDAGNYGGAIQRFCEYMNIMAEIKGAKDMYSIRVSHFDPKKELTELLMISHVYLEMARIYDAVPKFHGDSQKCLGQFVQFSANQPFQVVNSELIRKHLKKSVFKDQEAFRNAHMQIYVQSKKCYVVTFCYGDEHPVTQDCRLLKDRLLESEWGREIVRGYYSFSSVYVPRWKNSPLMKIFAFAIIRPLLLLFSKTILPLIIGKC